MTREAVLLVNLGSPASPSAPDVRRYLDEFLMDPYVLDLPAFARTLLVRGLILNTRPAKSAEAYAKIWTAEGSPLVVISRQTRAALESHMQLPVGLAMRYGEPSIAHGLDELLSRAGNIDELVVVALYPHYAMASTKTVEVAVDAALQGKNVRYRFLPPFYNDPGYLDALSARLRSDMPADPTFLLFSYHGIPERHVRKMDPTGAHCLRSADCCSTPSPAWATCYRHQVLATMDGVAQRLGLSKDAYGFAFQSRLGGGWLAGIAMVAREMGNAAVRVTQRHDCHFVPEQAAVFAVVAQQHPAGFATAQGVAQPVAPILFPVIGLQQTQVSSRKLRR